VSRIQLTDEEEAELYVLLKPREAELGFVLDGLLRSIERALFGRLTIEEIERLAARFSPGC